MPALAGCLGGSDTEWGTGSGEYSSDFDFDDLNGTITNQGIDFPSEENETLDLVACDEMGFGVGPAGYQSTTGVASPPWADADKVELSGWLVQTKTFDNPSDTYPALTSWMIKTMSFSDAQDTAPGELYVTIPNMEKDWESPTWSEALADKSDDDGEIPRKWALVGLIPANENVMEGILNLETNQAVEIRGYLWKGTGDSMIEMMPSNANLEENYDGDLSAYAAENSPSLDDDCQIITRSDGWAGNFVVTSVKHGDNDRVIDSKTAFVKGDVPLFGRTIYTIILLLSLVGAGAIYIFSRNVVLMSADERAQTMLSASQIRAGKTAVIEAKRHEAQLEAAAQKGSTRGKGRVDTGFDVSAALEHDSAGSGVDHYVAGTGVTATAKAQEFEDELIEMQADQAMEQELKKKGLRGIVKEFGGGGRGRRVTGGVTSSAPVKVESKPKPVVKEDPGEKLKKTVRKTRKTRKTAPKVEESEPEPVPEAESAPAYEEEEDDFSDFSL